MAGEAATGGFETLNFLCGQWPGGYDIEKGGIMPNIKYYVHVTEPTGEEYDIGPFDDVVGFMSNDGTAIEWIYKQIGMLKIVTDSNDLIKHKWNCAKAESSLSDPIIEIDVEMSGYRLVVKTLNATDHNLVPESLDAFV